VPNPVTTVPFTPAGDVLRAIHLPGRGTPAHEKPTHEKPAYEEPGREEPAHEKPAQESPVIHLSGLGCHSAASWSHVAVRRGRSALLVDLPGHERSDAPADLDYTLPTLAAAVATFIEAQQSGPVEILGHSLGGGVAVHLASTRPDLVRRLVLVEPALDPVPLRPGDIATEREDQLPHGGWQRILARESAWRRAEVKLTDPLALVRCARGLTDQHAARTSRLLLSLTSPVLMVLGKNRTYRDEAQFADHGIRLVRIPTAGHFVMNDCPTEFLEAVADHG